MKMTETDESKSASPNFKITGFCLGKLSLRFPLRTTCSAPNSEMKDDVHGQGEVAAVPPPPPQPREDVTAAPELGGDRMRNLRKRRAPERFRDTKVFGGPKHMKGPIFKEVGLEKGETSSVCPPPPTPRESEEIPAWKLRARRASVRFIEEEVIGISDGAGENKKRVRVPVAISKTKIEEDFVVLVGQKPPRRPRKKPTALKKELDALFPGLMLKEVSADMYKARLCATAGNI